MIGKENKNHAHFNPKVSVVDGDEQYNIDTKAHSPTKSVRAKSLSELNKISQSTSKAGHDPREARYEFHKEIVSLVSYFVQHIYKLEQNPYDRTFDDELFRGLSEIPELMNFTLSEGIYSKLATIAFNVFMTYGLHAGTLQLKEFGDAKIHCKDLEGSPTLKASELVSLLFSKIRASLVFHKNQIDPSIMHDLSVVKDIVSQNVISKAMAESHTSNRSNQKDSTSFANRERSRKITKSQSSAQFHRPRL